MSTHRSIAALAGLFFWASIPASLGQPPAKASDAGTIPEWHGIAAVHSHHADLAMLILEDEDHRTEPGKRLRAELRIREDQ